MAVDCPCDCMGNALIPGERYRICLVDDVVIVTYHFLLSSSSGTYVWLASTASGGSMRFIAKDRVTKIEKA